MCAALIIFIEDWYMKLSEERAMIKYTLLFTFFIIVIH